MTRDEIIDRIAAAAPRLKAEGATALYIYGSRARATHNADSDLDVYVDFEPESGFSLVELAGIELLLEAMLGLDVQVTTRGSLNPLMRASIERESVRAF